MNKALALNAEKAVTRDGYVRPPTWCQKYLRQNVESVYGDEFAEFMRGSARLTGEAFLEASPGKNFIAFRASDLDAHGGLQFGDILYKTEGSGGFGHVGIYTSKGVSENSSYHTHDDTPTDARGFRNLKQYGPFQIVVRLGDTDEEPKLIIARTHESGYIYQPVKSAEFEGGKFTVNESDLGGLLGIAGQAVRLSVREALDHLGFTVKKLGDHMADDENPRMYVFIAPK